MKEIELSFRNTDKKSFILGSITATLIAATPYLFYLYESVPDQQVWDTFLFTYDSKHYGSVFVLAWTLSNKFIPLFLLLIWFFTCRHWWYHVLLVPIAMFAYQIFTIFNEDLSYVDSKQILFLIPIMAIIVPSIYLIRAKMFNKINDAGKTMQDLEDEFKIKPKGFYGKIKEYF
ncbi:hypothetical protein [Gelidibacter mesophilus]|uniref:hypothetical protein n=1 Tax=Gelidibacter mesophilus TaxID=169050 RepID=UPI000415B522|nr:hypothetical protein [Gelidibacter mesophilus]